jgi:hypothetical protein
MPLLLDISAPYHAAAFFGFFVPYFDRLVALLPTPPYNPLATPSYPFPLSKLTKSIAPLTK